MIELEPTMLNESDMSFLPVFIVSAKQPILKYGDEQDVSLFLNFINHYSY